MTSGPTTALERPMPASLETEQALLGTLMVNNTLMPQALRLVKMSFFSIPKHRRIFQVMVALYEEQMEINIVTVAGKFSAEDLQQIGGQTYLVKLTSGIPYFNKIDDYVEILKRKAQRRWFIQLSRQIALKAYDDAETEEEIATFAGTNLSQVLERIGEQRGFRPLAQIQVEAEESYGWARQGRPTAIPTGFQQIDRWMTDGGMRFGDLIVIAARPSLGKTSLARDISVNCAKRGVQVGFASVEMSDLAQFKLIHSAESGVERMRMGQNMDSDNFRLLVETIDQVGALPILINDRVFAADDLRMQVRELKRQGKIDLLVVDYMQLMEASERGSHQSQNDEVGEIATTLKQTAKENRIPVIALSQLSRKCDEGKGREPELTDLRSSGQIEQDADVVLFLYGKKPAEGRAIYPRTLICKKQREGPLFREELEFNGPFQTFRGPEFFDRAFVEQLIDEEIEQ